MSKLDQLRALRERRFTTTPTKGFEPGEKIILNGELMTITGTVSICPECGQPVHKGSFDKRAYQREYMRKRRAADKERQK